MKNFLLVIILIALSNFGFSQPDDTQWYIYQAAGSTMIKEATAYSSVPTFTNFNICGESCPAGVQINNTTQENDFFIIYKNGKHFNSRGGTLGHCVSGGWSEGYEVIPQSEVAYFYLTNVYEGDDPDALISMPGAACNTGLKQISITETQANNIISCNHSIVKNKDFTLIINALQLKRICESNQIDICFYIKDGGTSTPYQNMQQTNIFDGETLLFGSQPSTIGTRLHCLQDITLDFGKPYSYVNLKAPLGIEDYTGKDLKIVIEGGSCTDSITEKILDSHDPNFIEVKCVSKCGNKKYVKYYAQCINDETMPVNGLDFVIYQLPYVSNEVTLLNSGVISSSAGFSNSSSSAPIQGAMNSTIFTFNSVGLGQGDIAWVEYCAEIDIKMDLSTVVLQPQSAHTSFDGTHYPIMTFIDSVNVENVQSPQNANYGDRWTRPISSSEECGCCEPNVPCWVWPIAAFLASLLLIYLIRKRRT